MTRRTIKRVDAADVPVLIVVGVFSRCGRLFHVDVARPGDADGVQRTFANHKITMRRV